MGYLLSEIDQFFAEYNTLPWIRPEFQDVGVSVLMVIEEHFSSQLLSTKTDLNDGHHFIETGCIYLLSVSGICINGMS